ncbi:DUF4224 domain-containing protein [Aromatoleum toluolicum]|uniref:DUF4224 domain-containing protein n=1 Tax=Aromatoleum toluolicum TaxID=90060 RepID=A0ABX1NJP5_9RHOO|nr:DUF4224 domain-containing protein [Aromatoleum toluolicum]NMF99549.1 DUF4224 domain-containing protein [Aromatoleum toluolicum]
MFLNAQEVRDLTGRQRVTAQAKALDSMGIPYRRRPDGTLAVLRTAVEAILGGDTITPKAASAKSEPKVRPPVDDGRVHPWDYAKGRKKKKG